MPVLNDIEPLVPLLPAFDVKSVKAPLLVCVPRPVTIDADPPVSSILSPALMTRRPPAPLSPLPTLTLILPPAPDVEVPVFRVMDPLLPLLAVPVLSDNEPLTPLEPSDDVRKVNDPLLVALP